MFPGLWFSLFKHLGSFFYHFIKFLCLWFLDFSLDLVFILFVFVSRSFKCLYFLYCRENYVKLCSSVHVNVCCCWSATENKIWLVFFTFFKYWWQYRWKIWHFSPLFLFLLFIFFLSSEMSQQDDLVYTFQKAFLLWHFAGNVVESVFSFHEVLLREVNVIFQNLLKC